MKYEPGTTIDLSEYHLRFNIKRLSFKEQTSFVSFYRDNALIHDMVYFCEVMNPKSIKSKVISVASAIGFFFFQSLNIEDDTAYM